VNILLSREIYVYSSMGALRDRIIDWGKTVMFKFDSESADSLVLKRGSHLKAGYSFDVRQIPTSLELKFHGEFPSKLIIKLHCKTYLSMETPGDKKRIAKDLDLLEDALWKFNEEVAYKPHEQAGQGKCGKHPERSAILVCQRCGEFSCHSCRGYEDFCIPCVQKRREQ
jgi:hypothetical protein